MSGDITFEELSGKKDSFKIIDVRNPGELESEGHIPGAHNIPMPELEEALKLDNESFSAKYGFGKPEAGDTVVTHCQKGARARKAGDLVASTGLTVRVYAGSFDDWKAKGGEIAKGKP
ncbi:rhodanese domain-containing protein CG4456-like [Macrobrachium rosenbergii]|uniref:rhodanese domain-containing protein CG4456-like n=1 Tax=Macrobrachium rosenbergii TaxID=79674 RepID=UPI0034D393D0